MNTFIITKKWFLAAIIFLMALLILKIILFLTAKPKITVDYVAEYNRTACPQDYDPNENAAPSYQKAFDMFIDMPSQFRWPLKNWPTDLNESDQNTLSQWLASNEQAFGYFREASQKPYYWLERRSERDSTVAGIMVPELDLFCQLTKALLWEAKTKAIQGQFQQAFEDILFCYNAGQHKCRSSLLLVEQLNGLNIKEETFKTTFVILSKSNIESTALEFFQDALQSELDNNDYIPDIQTEKYFLYDALQRTFIDNGKGTGRLAWRAGWYVSLLAELNKSDLQRKGNSLKQRLHACFAGPTRNEVVGQIEKVFALSAKLMGKTPWQIKNEAHDFFNEIEGINKNNWFLKLFCINPQNIFELYNNTGMQAEALVTVLATLRYRIDKGQFPETINELVSSRYLQTVPNDSYSNGSLIYRLMGDGFKLYSVGENFKDDGGVVKLDIIYWPVQQQRAGETCHGKLHPRRN
ncbi:hypothetical protein L21SP3_00463 [Sedimentisphaera cyanobacteriorum]|uniref:Uncharacterized protein n=1 Tax=Sedimentisphaera cyanobacteriorum TaxID=1940790 RepID=A0A1Q2HN37_9BACT|nr:hypothetical protein [Sedimentisphaera cyanobacteriorum]AQQ08674.1 hypothetical protein L21SP3_00463 [Sedimentisphaera cyanobacteriorum]